MRDPQPEQPDIKQVGRRRRGLRSTLERRRLNPVSSAAAQEEPTSKQVLFSDVAATKKRRRFKSRTWNSTDYVYIAFMTVMHGLCLLAPATFSWRMVGRLSA